MDNARLQATLAELRAALRDAANQIDNDTFILMGDARLPYGTSKKEHRERRKRYTDHLRNLAAMEGN